MRKSVFRNLIIFLSLAISSMNGICQSPSVRESDKASDAALINTDKSKIEMHLHIDGHSSRAHVVFSNLSKATLWFPIEPTPTFRPDEQLHRLEIWFGYFDEVYGPYKGDYMVPPMHPLKPGENFKLELTSPLLVRQLSKKGRKTIIQARVATKALEESRIRNDQPLEDYISNSIVIESVNSASK